MLNQKMQSLGRVGSEEVPQRESLTLAVITRLRDTVGAQTEMLKSLEMRLAPVISPRPTTAKEAEPEPFAGPELPRAIDAIAQHVERNNRMIGELIETVEL